MKELWPLEEIRVNAWFCMDSVGNFPGRFCMDSVGNCLKVLYGQCRKFSR